MLLKYLKKFKKTKIIIGMFLVILISVFSYYEFNKIRKQKIYESINIAFASNKVIEI